MRALLPGASETLAERVGRRKLRRRGLRGRPGDDDHSVLCRIPDLTRCIVAEPFEWCPARGKVSVSAVFATPQAAQGIKDQRNTCLGELTDCWGGNRIGNNDSFQTSPPIL